ncbi:hypothetical protein RB195_009803 [Necator americanus]|uniref:tRNA-intron lyase n=1 Tax=Necator americanus TaxID=51031 RepID=A0ABR1CW84_NECAM
MNFANFSPNFKCFILLNQYITVDYVNNSFFIFDEQDILRLRNDWRIIAQTGSSAQDQLPYFLSPEQVAVLVLYGAARVRVSVKNALRLQQNAVLEKEFNSGVNNDEECSSERNDDMMSKNDSRFIAFKKSIPGEVHAKYLLDFVMDDEEASMINIISLVRVATQVKKELLLAVVASDSSHPHYISFNRFRPYSKEYE